MLVSHALGVLQLAKPGEQPHPTPFGHEPDPDPLPLTHFPCKQLSVPLHGLPQTPQLLGSVRMFVSQPELLLLLFVPPPLPPLPAPPLLLLHVM